MYEKLKNYLSEERLKTYLYFTNNDKEKAIELYELNARYSSQFQIMLSHLEVILRNCINNAMIKYNENWLIEFEQINEKLLDNFKNKIKNDKTIKGYEKFFNIQNSLINEAKNELIFNKKLITNNNLVSRLTFGFWNRLFNKKYDGILWNKYLYKIFNKKINRQNVEEILELFRVFRNRIAHNECIINRELTVLRYYDEIINFVNLIDNEICNWLKKQMSRTLFE